MIEWEQYWQTVTAFQLLEMEVPPHRWAPINKHHWMLALNCISFTPFRIPYTFSDNAQNYPQPLAIP
jgi:hypothetical protein